MEVGHSELGLETKRKSKIPVRVYLIAFLDFFQSENLGFENCIELLHFDCVTFKSLNNNIVLVLFPLWFEDTTLGLYIKEFLTLC